jgi:hypothetical protein
MRPPPFVVGFRRTGIEPDSLVEILEGPIIVADLNVTGTPVHENVSNVVLGSGGRFYDRRASGYGALWIPQIPAQIPIYFCLRLPDRFSGG